VNHERLGDAILCFYGFEDLMRAVESGLAHTPGEVFRFVFDNSEDFRIGEWVMYEHPEITYIRSPYNIGCCPGRNRIAEAAIRAGCTHWVVRDQDVEIIADGWMEDMLAVFRAHPDTGLVGWKLGYDQMSPRFQIDETGMVPETPGLCSMYSAESVRAVGGWNPAYFFYRGEDSRHSLAIGLKGYKTRLVLGVQKIAHNNPHQGLGRQPKMKREGERSLALFERETVELGFPRIPGINT